MAINQKRMSGRFMVIPFEVYDILERLKWPSVLLYMSIIRKQYIHEDWDSDDTWVIGYVKATKTELFTTAPIGEGTFYETAWPGLAKAGLVGTTMDGRIVLPMYKKKADVGVSPSELADLRSRIEQLENALEHDEDPETPEIPDKKGGQPENTTKASGAEGNPSGAEGNPSGAEASSHARDSLFRDLDIDIDIEEEEAGGDVSARGQEESGKILTLRGKSQKNFLTEKYKRLMAQLDDIWPGRGVKLPGDADYLVALHGFPDEALDEALQAAKENKIKYGNYDWILNRLQNPELFIGKKGRKKKSQEWDPDICGLEADWLKVK